MDPNAVLQQANQAIRDGDTVAAVEALLNYYRWRVGGGSEPTHDELYWYTTLDTNGDVVADQLGYRLLDIMEFRADV